MNTPKSPRFSPGLPRITGAHAFFISGAAQEHGTWSRTNAEAFMHKLSRHLASKKYRLITGFGVGVGGAVINRALAYLNEAGKRRFPTRISSSAPSHRRRLARALFRSSGQIIRKAMHAYADIAVSSSATSATCHRGYPVQRHAGGTGRVCRARRLSSSSGARASRRMRYGK